MSATSEFMGEVAGAKQSNKCAASMHCIKHVMDNNHMTKWIANSSTNEEITFDVQEPRYIDAIFIKFSEGRAAGTVCDVNSGSGTVCGGDAIQGACYANEAATLPGSKMCRCYHGWIDGDGGQCTVPDPGATTTTTMTTMEPLKTTVAVTTGAVTTGAVTTGAVTTGAVTTGAVTTGAVTTAAMTTADQADTGLTLPTTIMPPLTCLMERSSMSYTRIQNPSVITYAVEVVKKLVLPNLPNKIHKCASHCSADPDCVIIGFDNPISTCYICHVAVNVTNTFLADQEYLCAIN
ncbi:PREDICTED: uncharacterized protein LOC106819349 [Priapulus caudatus]|uniref:Uncharacterized protein LOC106819349 n=1 Tax=Priapulus caudatus TaxID=37621 RepID=A0ABM1F4W0_PRICU|nr:PREDICTED: uncharacterized protein LOC106819349 [Priapulus caudatus]